VKCHSEQGEEAEGTDEPDQSHPLGMNQVHSLTRHDFVCHAKPKGNCASTIPTKSESVSSPPISQFLIPHFNVIS